MYWIGTSGYNYPEWKGSFYPPKLPAAQMLAYYAARFPSVEINYTFYRIPNEQTLASWARQTPAAFRLTLKAPRRITHDLRLRGSEELTASFCRTALTLGDRLGALLFQLPPSLKKDLGLLRGFLEVLPPLVRPAFEFRHESWHEDEVFDALREHGAALCVADSERMSTPVVLTAGFAYFRLRDEGYTRADLEQWASTLRERAGGVSDVYVYFKHEEAGKGPEFARALMDLLGVTYQA